MPSNWNEATGAVETLMEQYQRESAEQDKGVWNLLEDAKRSRLPGMTLQCSLFCRVNAVRSDSHMGKLVGEIPDWLQREARIHDFKVIGADYLDNKYTLEILTHNAGVTGSGEKT